MSNPAFRMPLTTTDLFDAIARQSDDSLGAIQLDATLKDDLYELLGTAIKEAMRLRESYPVRLSAPRRDNSLPLPGEGTVLDLYVIETADLIETYANKVAARIERFVNDEMADTLATHASHIASQSAKV